MCIKVRKSRCRITPQENDHKFQMKLLPSLRYDQIGHGETRPKIGLKWCASCAISRSQGMKVQNVQIVDIVQEICFKTNRLNWSNPKNVNGFCGYIPKILWLLLSTCNIRDASASKNGQLSMSTLHETHCHQASDGLWRKNDLVPIAMQWVI